MARFSCFFFFLLTTFLLACNSNQPYEPKPALLDTISYETLSSRACAYLKATQDSFRKEYNIDSLHWFYDDSVGTMIFSKDGQNKVILDYEVVGSVSEKAHTFLWAWDNATVNLKVKEEIRKVWAYGEKRNFEKLKTAEWKADLTDGWDMTAIAAYLLHTKGCYRIEGDSGLYFFMIFKNVRWVDSSYLKKR